MGNVVSFHDAFALNSISASFRCFQPVVRLAMFIRKKMLATRFKDLDKHVLIIHKISGLLYSEKLSLRIGAQSRLVRAFVYLQGLPRSNFFTTRP